MSIFQRAWQNLPLSPGERAFLKLLKGWLFTAIGVGLIAGAQYLTNNQQINVWALIEVAGGAMALSVLMALDKWFSAQGDLPAAVMTEAVTQRVQAALPGLIAQHIATLPQAQPQRAVQPQQAVLAPTVTNMAVHAPVSVPQVLQVPFPPSGTVNYSNLSFGDTGIVPSIPK